MTRTSLVLGAVAILGASASADPLPFAKAGPPVVVGAQELQIDVDALSAQASGAFSETFTGSLHVFNTAVDPDINGNARILDVLIDGSAQGTGGADAAHFSFDLSITFSGGDITGGSLSVAVDQGGSENTYTASLSTSSGGAILDIGGGTFIIGGLTFDGTFADAAGTFLGVDISNWGSRQPLPGRFSEIAFNPDARGLDRDTDVDVFVTVPLPSGIAMASLGLVAVVARRRR